MASTKIKLTLKSEFPVLDNLENTRGSVVFHPEERSKVEKVHLLWAHDIMPTPEGLSSVVRIPWVTTPYAGSYDPRFPTRVKKVYDENGLMLFHYRAAGRDLFINANVVVDAGSASGGNSWTSYGGTGLGVTIFFSVDALARTYALGFGFHTVTPVGLDLAAVGALGYCRALNYSIVFTKDTIYWSAPGNFGEFREEVATVATGAGSTKLIEQTGRLVAVFPISNGFMIYGTDQTISAQYSKNPAFPWVFNDIENSGGAVSADRIAFDAFKGEHFGITKRGVLNINVSECKELFPELSNFINGSVFFDSNLAGVYNKLTSYYTSGNNIPLPLSVRCNIISGRYFTISYGLYEQVFKYCLIYDLALKQWGKLKVDHLDIFEYDNPDYIYIPGTTKLIPAPSNLGVLKSDGTVDRYRTFYQDQVAGQDAGVSSSGELLFGDIRYTTDTLISITKIELFGIVAANVHVYVQSRMTESSAYTEVEFIQYVAGSKTFLGFVTGAFHRLRIVGALNLQSIEIEVANAGER